MNFCLCCQHDTTEIICQSCETRIHRLQGQGFSLDVAVKSVYGVCRDYDLPCPQCGEKHTIQYCEEFWAGIDQYKVKCSQNLAL
jgi:hypothetical protein